MHALMLFAGWSFFVMGAVDLVALSYSFAIKEESSVGLGAVIRWLLTGAAFAAWQYLTFGR